MRKVATRLAACALSCAASPWGVGPTQARPSLGTPLGAPGAAGAHDEHEQHAAAPLVLRAQHVVVRPGEVVHDVLVLVRDGRIERVGADLEIPEGATVVEGHTVCAGFVDAWSALGLSSSALEGNGTSPATRTADGVDVFEDDHLRREALGAGVVAARLQGGAAQNIGGYGAVVRLAPSHDIEAALLAADAGIGMALGLSRETSGSFVMQPDGSWAFEEGSSAMDPFDRLGGIERVVSQLESGRSYAEDLVEYRYELEEWQKAIAEAEKKLEKDFKNAKKKRDKEIKEAEEKDKEFKEERYKEDKQPREPKYDEDKEAMARVVQGEVPLVVEVHRAAEIRYLLELTAPFSRLRLVIAGGSEAHLVAEELAERDVPVICWPALRGTDEMDEYDGPGVSLAAHLAEAGVPVLFGSGGRSAPATRDLPLLAQVAIAHGLDREAALAALTIDAARAFDVADRLGSVEPGKDAELIVLDGEPLHTATRVTHAVSGGRLVVRP